MLIIFLILDFKGNLIFSYYVQCPHKKHKIKAKILHSNNRNWQSFLPPDSGLYCSHFRDHSLKSHKALDFWDKDKKKFFFPCSFQATEKFTQKDCAESIQEDNEEGKSAKMLPLLTCVSALEWSCFQLG